MDPEMQAVFVWNFALCFGACLIAAVWGRISRKNNRHRLIKAATISLLGSWTLFIGGGGIGLFPSLWLLGYIVHGILLGKNGFLSSFSYLYISITLASFLLIFLSFWFFSRKFYFIDENLT